MIKLRGNVAHVAQRLRELLGTRVSPFPPSRIILTGNPTKHRDFGGDSVMVDPDLAARKHIEGEEPSHE